MSAGSISKGQSTAAGAERIHLPALLVASTTLVVPITVITSVIWAQLSFAERHPDYVAARAATISRAISDPAIGGPFAAWMTLCAILIVFASSWIFRVQATAIRQTTAAASSARRAAWLGLGCFAVAQAAGCIGMVVLVHFSLADNNAVHMAGSYLLFAGLSVAIASSAALSAALMKVGRLRGMQGDDSSLSPRLSAFRVRFAFVVVVLALTYLALFILKDIPLPIERRTIIYAYVTLEFVLLVAFMLYFVSFAPEMYRHASPALPNRPQTDR